MKLLILGGTVFVGRHFVAAALERGHEVTLFHRGKRGAELFPQVERVLGDRDGGLDALAGRTFDAVVDTCGYVPRVVRQSAEAFKGRADAYLFVSTVSVYAEDAPPRSDESADLQILKDETAEEITNETYGGLKVLCEQAVAEHFAGRVFVVRPGFIVGPHDPTNRFTYYPRRVAEGGKMLVPNVPNDPLEVIDARDLAQFMLQGLERQIEGVYNTAGPEVRFAEMLEACRPLNPGVEFVWADFDFLEKRGIELWKDLPMAMPPGESTALMTVRSDRAVASGLRYRPLEETARDTAEWFARERPAGPYGAGLLTPEREAEAIRLLESGSS